MQDLINRVTLFTALSQLEQEYKTQQYSPISNNEENSDKIIQNQTPVLDSQDRLSNSIKTKQLKDKQPLTNKIQKLKQLIEQKRNLPSQSIEILKKRLRTKLGSVKQKKLEAVSDRKQEQKLKFNERQKYQLESLICMVCFKNGHFSCHRIEQDKIYREATKNS